LPALRSLLLVDFAGLQVLADDARLDELIERIERAPAPSEVLDRAIAEVVSSGRVASAAAMRFTASFPATLRIVPVGWEWLVRNDGAGGGFANVHWPGPFVVRAVTIGGRTVMAQPLSDPDGRAHRSYAATPLLALCAAALKARSWIVRNGAPN